MFPRITFVKIYTMRFDSPVPITTIAQLTGAEIIGNSKGAATGINEIHMVEPGDLVFVDHPKYYSTCINSAATFIIINKKTDFPEGKTLLVVADPFEAYLKIVNHYRPFQPSMKNVSDSATIGDHTVIMPNSYIGNHVRIGDNCIIHPNVTILDHCIIGNNVIIQAGTVIGSDAFY
jgi:UDP-3-O-[3-hydroxymyristoyl] glucosamine N-acyltransferase